MFHPAGLRAVIAIVLLLAHAGTERTVSDLQDAPKENATREDPLDIVSERSKQLRSFIAEYRVRSGESEGAIRIVYRAPGSLRLDLQMDDKELVSVAAGGVWSMVYPHDGVTGRCEFEDTFTGPLSRVEKGLLARFPKGDMKDLLGPFRPFLRIDFGTEDPTGKPSVQLIAGVSPSVDSPFSWLTLLRRKGRLVEEKDEELVYEIEPGRTMSVRRDSGLVASITLKWHDETKRSLELIRSELDTDLESGAFDLPRVDSPSKDMSQELRGGLTGTIALETGRTVMRSIRATTVGSGKPWDAEAKARTAAVLEIMHDEFLALDNDFVEQNTPRVDAFTAWAQAAFAAAGAEPSRRDEVERIIEDWNRKLREPLDSMRQQFLFVSTPRGEAPDSFWKEMAEIDRAAAEKAFDKRVADPLLERFAERIALAREGKLEVPEPK